MTGQHDANGRDIHSILEIKVVKSPRQRPFHKYQNQIVTQDALNFSMSFVKRQNAASASLLERAAALGNEHRHTLTLQAILFPYLFIQFLEVCRATTFEHRAL